jgi:hypothetical protein
MSSMHDVMCIGRRARACKRLSEAAKTLTTRDHVRGIGGPSTPLNTIASFFSFLHCSSHHNINNEEIPHTYTSLSSLHYRFEALVSCKDNSSSSNTSIPKWPPLPSLSFLSDAAPTRPPHPPHQEHPPNPPLRHHQHNSLGEA